MRILTFIHSFEPGGVERVAIRLVRHWRGLGADVTLFVGRDCGALREELMHGLRYETPSRPSRMAASSETAWTAFHLARLARRSAPDLIFCPGNTYTVVAGILRLVLGDRCPPIVSKISNDLAREDLGALPRACWRWWLRRQRAFVDHWIVIDQAMDRDFRAHLGDAPRTVIPNPVIGLADLSRAVGVERPPGIGRRFVSVGRLVPQKNLQLMLRAFAAGAGSEDSLAIIGDGSMKGELTLLAARLGLAGRVEWRGHEAEAAQSLANYDILLLSSSYEGVPAVVAEALAAGLGVVATDCGPGVRGLLGNGLFGRLSPGDLPSFTAAVATASSPSAEDRESIAAHVRRYAIEEVGARYLDAFAACATRRRTPATIRFGRGKRAALLAE